LTLVPVRTVPLVSDLPPAALADALRGLVGDGPADPFAGTVGADGFTIRGMRAYRSTHLPLVRGRIAPADGGGARVSLRLRPATVTLVFMAIWLGFLAAVAALIVAAHAGGGRSLAWLLLPGGLAALTWGLLASVFSAEARWGVEHLLERVPALRRAPDSPDGWNRRPSAGIYASE